MPRKAATEHPDDIGVHLAAPVTPAQRDALHTRGYHGPTPSTNDQAEAILRQLTTPPAPEARP